MNSVEKPVTEARKEFADLVNRVAYTGERVALTRRGKIMAALVSAEDLELLEGLRAGRLDVTQTGPEVQPADRPQPGPLRIAAEYRPPGPPRPPGFGH